MKLVYLSAFWVIGIYIGSHLAHLPTICLLALLPGILLVLCSFKKRSLLLWGLCLLALVGGVLHFEPPDLGTLQSYNDAGTVIVRGVVDGDPELLDGAERLRIVVREVCLDDDCQTVSGVALVYISQFPSYKYGDVLELTGELETPPTFEDFDYQDYLARRGIGSTMFRPDVELLERGRGSPILGWLYSLRGGMADALSSSLPQPQASLSQSVLLGLRSNIPDEVYCSFSRTGTAHLLAISGLHVSVVAGMFLSIGAWLFGRRRPTYILVTLFAIWGYVAVSGAHPSALRAAIMASLFLYAVWIGRPRSAMAALAFAAAVMVAVSPRLLWEVSFQLSFVAMAGLILLAPPFQEWGRKTPVPGVIVDSFAITLAAIIATLPIVAYYFNIVSLVGLPATLLILPALPAILVTSALTGLFGLFAPPLGIFFGWLAFPFLWYMNVVVQGFAALPFYYLEVPRFNGAMVFIYYIVIAGFLWGGGVRRRIHVIPRLFASLRRLRPRNIIPRVRTIPMRLVISILLIVAIGVWACALVTPQNELRVSFLDVGQGDAILIRTPSGHNILIDGGPSSEDIGLRLGEELPFWDRDIDLVILTHPDSDHLTGLVEVLSHYNVGQVLEPDLSSLEDFNSPLYDEWQRLIEERGIEHTFAQAGQLIDLGDGITLEVLNPQEALLTDTSSDTDNNGIVLRLEYGDISFLLTADIFEEGEQYLADRGFELESTVLKVAHHGSSTSTSPDFLAAVDPQIAVISVGEDNPYGHPSPEVAARLYEMVGEDMVYLTSECGTITFITDGAHLWVRTGR